MKIHRITIEYCTQCRWMMRAAWLAQELLVTFETDISQVALVPSSGGIFQVRLNDHLLFDRKTQSRFPETKEIKQLIRNQIDPERSLGHSDGHINNDL